MPLHFEAALCVYGMRVFGLSSRSISGRVRVPSGLQMPSQFEAAFCVYRMSVSACHPEVFRDGFESHPDCRCRYILERLFAFIELAFRPVIPKYFGTGSIPSGLQMPSHFEAVIYICKMSVPVSHPEVYLHGISSSYIIGVC